jgi:hypothetical protein
MIMIDKKKIDQDDATNTSAAISAVGTMIAAINGVVYHRDFGDWMPVVLMGCASTVAQWLQGTPSSKSQLIASVLRLDGAATNAQLLRSAIDRLMTSGVVPGLGVSQPETMRPSPSPTRLRVNDQARAIADQMEQRLAERQRPQQSQPMNRTAWNEWNGTVDSNQRIDYPQIIQTGFDPDEIGPSTTAR